LGDETLLDWGAARFGIQLIGNVHSGELSGSNVLYLAKTTDELMLQFSVSTQVADKREREVRARLYKAREQRPPVPVDDKVVTVWNGYMITTLAEAGTIFQDPGYKKAAQAAADFILQELYDPKTRTLYRDWRNGERGVPGFAEDYGAMAEASLALYEITGEKRWLQTAKELTDTQIERFWDEKNGGFFSTTADTELWLRDKKSADGATPSPNSIAIQNLLELAQLTKDPKYTRYATRTATWVGGLLQEIPNAMPYTLMAWPGLMAHDP